MKVNSTTFMVQLLTKLGLDTGFTTEEIKISNKANAGLEMGIYERWDKATKTWVPNPQYIVKSPLMCDKLDQALEFDNVIIDHVYIPVREIDSVVASRVRVGEGPGGYLEAENPEELKLYWLNLFHQLIVSLVRHDIPHSFLMFPKFVTDTEYCYEKLAFLVGDTSYDEFLQAFKAVSDDKKIHRF